MLKCKMILCCHSNDAIDNNKIYNTLRKCYGVGHILLHQFALSEELIEILKEFCDSFSRKFC